MRPIIHVFTAEDFGLRKMASNREVRSVMRRRALRRVLLIAIARAVVITFFEITHHADLGWWMYGAAVWSAFTTGSFLRHFRDLP